MTENNFAEFEAAAIAGEPAPEPADTPPAPAPNDEPIELTDDDEAVDVSEDEEGGEEHTDAEGKKRRSKPAAQRIAELTAKLRETERRLAARDAPAEEAKSPERPKPEDFEFGEADPAYIEKLTDWKIETREAEKAKAEGARAEHQAMVEKINVGVGKAEEAAKAKYEDFDAKIAAAVDARGGEPLPPLLTIGIGVSPVGGDILYRLATDEAVSERLETLAKGGQATSKQMAMALGEIEGEYLADDSDADLDLADDLDTARLLGRMRARLKGAKAPDAKPAAAIADTRAPEPPKHQVRGGAGKFEVGADTQDFAAFEKKVNGSR